MGGLEVAQIIVATISVSGIGYTAWAALKGKREEIQKPDWPTYARELRQNVADLRVDLNKQDDKIDDLYRKLGEMRDELHTEQRRSNILLAYLRRVLAWASDALPEHRPPPPPSDLADDLADLWRETT